MNHGDIKMAIDMLDQLHTNEPSMDNTELDHCVNVLEDCGNEIDKLRKMVEICAETFDMYAAGHKVKMDIAMDEIDKCSSKEKWHRNQLLAFNCREVIK